MCSFMGNLRLGVVGYISQKVKPSLERLFGPGQKKTTLLTPGMMLVFPNEELFWERISQREYRVNSQRIATRKLKTGPSSRSVQESQTATTLK